MEVEGEFLGEKVNVPNKTKRRRRLTWINGQILEFLLDLNSWKKKRWAFLVENSNAKVNVPNKTKVNEWGKKWI